ncbi:MAG: hypothetical protein BWK80_48870 [Desulfobacteraceae bacterium IS3]|nr:MAG: hypothetical protein BWK80_48870 [Desulfobacteraceae bacterium IS3]
MNLKNPLQLAYGLAVVLLIVGVLSYTAFSAKAPDEPVRLVFQCSTGKVMFDHKTHTAESGYGIACTDCHHHPENAEDKTSCRVCHALPEDGSTPAACLNCHDADEAKVENMLNQSISSASAVIRKKAQDPKTVRHVMQLTVFNDPIPENRPGFNPSAFHLKFHFSTREERLQKYNFCTPDSDFYQRRRTVFS